MSNLRHLIRGISQLDVKPKGPDTDISKYDKYIARLKAPLSLTESIATAIKLVTWINQYQLGNPSQPWLVSRRLVKADMPSNARLAGLDLYKACVQSRPDLPAIVRLMFFQDIEIAFGAEDFDLQLEAFVALTKDGRDISGFETRVCSSLARWVDRALVNLDNRKPFIRRLVPISMTMRHEELRRVIALITNVVKCHFAVLEESSISILVERIVLTCKRTGDAEDIQEALTFLDVIIRYGYIPSNVLTEVVCVICSIYHALDVLQDAALLVMRNLLRSHMSQGTLRALRSIILGLSNVHDDVILGALGILTTRWTHQSREEHATYTFTLEALLDTYKEGLSSIRSRPDRNQYIVDNGFLRSVLDIVGNEAIARDLSFDDWGTLFDILCLCSRSLEYRPNASTTREEVLTNIAVLEDTYLHLLRIIEPICGSKGASLPMHRMAELWTRLASLLPESSALLLLKFHGNELTFFPSNPNWLKDMNAIATSLLGNASQSQAVRNDLVKQLRQILPLLDQESERHLFHSTLLSLMDKLRSDLDVDCNAQVCAMMIEILEQGSLENATRAQQLILSALCRQSRDGTATSVHRLSSIDVETTDNSHFPELRSPEPSGTLEKSVLTAQLTFFEQILLEQLLQLFSSTFESQDKYNVMATILHMLCTIIEQNSTVPQVKLRILTALSSLRADSECKLYLETKDSDTAEDNSSSRRDAIASKYSCRDPANTMSLGIQRYLTILQRILTDEINREINLFVVVKLKLQLCNRQLFTLNIDTIHALRQVICERLTGGRSHLAFHDDLVVHYVHILAMLTGYHENFNKLQEDEIVAALQSTLMRFQKATQACIHTMTVCAYELPLSTTKNLPSILIRLSQLVTSTNAAIHILDFLSALATIPNLYINFREDDYRRVFGIALQHIQHANATSREALINKQQDPLADPITAYVLSLAFDALCAWFLAIRLAQRPKYLKWIVDGLLSANPQSPELDSRSLACYDFLARFCYSNSEIKSSTSVLKEFEADQSSVKSWLYGNAVVTMKTMNLSGLTEITIRRPSGSTSFLCKPNSDLEALSLISSVDAKNIVTNDTLVGPTESKIRNVIAGLETTAFTPSHILLQTAVPPELFRNQKPLLLLDDDTVRRSLATLDRIPVVDFHKIGVIYIGRGQSQQAEILANTYGSLEYVRFLEGLGELVRLKDNTSIYTGGLDTQADEDGEFAYTYRERITQVIFHTCTLMPYRPETDPESNRKKSHIGNDFVRIVWNNSNRPYNVNTIPSEFNFINIVISPDASLTTTIPRTGTSASTESFYKIKIQSQHELPDISPVSDWRLISASHVSTFVRTIAIHCNIFAQIYHAHGTYSGTWNQRLERINVLRQRTVARTESGPEEHTSTGYDFTSYN